MLGKRTKAKPRAERIIAALDVGSSKVTTAIAVTGPDEAVPRIIGSHQMRCGGLQNGIVVDLKAAEKAIRVAVDRAERSADTLIDEVVIGISAGGLEADVETVEIPISGQRVEEGDLETLRQQAVASINPGERAVLHATSALYSIDGQGEVLNPIGLHAHTLGAAIHLVMVDSAPLKNLDRAVRSADLDVAAVMAAPLASASACLSKEEREIGVALVEIGAGVTNVAVFARGMLAGFSSIPTGGADVTDDVANALGTPRLSAERLKALKGSASALPRDNHELIDVPTIANPDEVVRRPRAELVQAIRTRLDILFGQVSERFEEIGFVGPRANQVVLTGGGAALTGISDYAEGMLGRRVRIGTPRGVADLPEAQMGPAYSALIGLLLRAADDDPQAFEPGVAMTAKSAGGGALGRMLHRLRENF
ncbi:MAG: cell division protein FtsA [Pacificimonas sp.]|jgi:cell division protein FtsA|nr:cell division protein FtsA [Pacificimonas sp.]